VLLAIVEGWLDWLLSAVATPVAPGAPAAPGTAAPLALPLQLFEMCCMLLTLRVRCSPVVFVDEAAFGVVDEAAVVVLLPVPNVPVTATVCPTCSLS
jgi:hypothetical protein